jgi:hypothetical protein
MNEGIVRSTVFTELVSVSEKDRYPGQVDLGVVVPATSTVSR